MDSETGATPKGKNFLPLYLAFSYLLAEKITCSAEMSIKKFNNLVDR